MQNNNGETTVSLFTVGFFLLATCEALLALLFLDFGTGIVNIDSNTYCMVQIVLLVATILCGITAYRNGYIPETLIFILSSIIILAFTLADFHKFDITGGLHYANVVIAIALFVGAYLSYIHGDIMLIIISALLGIQQLGFIGFGSEFATWIVFIVAALAAITAVIYAASNAIYLTKEECGVFDYDFDDDEFDEEFDEEIEEESN